MNYYNDWTRNKNTNITSLYFDRMYEPIVDRYIQRRAFPPLIDRLEQEGALKGHEGCVNCLEWSSDGRILASGSDDWQVILWDPFRKRKLQSIRTQHLGNMFSVKFLPRHNDALIATAAADKYIYVFDVNRPSDIILGCNCHAARVKRLATAPDSPYVFWSAGEDGKILQLDIREEHRCRSAESQVLVNLTTVDANAEAKCVAVNPRRTEYLAVGANDPYARVYDRRSLKSSSITTSIVATAAEAPIPVGYYCPGHINKNNSKVVEHESRAITYLTFNVDGTELLVNMGGEQIYLYDLLNTDLLPVFLSLPEYNRTAEVMDVSVATGDSSHSDDQPSPSMSLGSAISPNRRKLPDHIESKKKLGNEFLENEKYLRAIDQYSEAISLAPQYSVLYLNRATAYMRRLWFGDVYAALRDCHEALRIDPGYIKAHFRLARALLELGRPQEADECLKELINRFPSYASNHGVMMLHKDIKESRQTAAAPPPNGVPLSDNEFAWRSKARDYTKRYIGHCNTTTDIKEANYFGCDGDFIVAGSDDGNFFMWERTTGKIRAIYKADGAIVNCVQPHPDFPCLMATSGIDHDVKIWSPVAPSPDERPNLVTYIDKCVEENQHKMMTDPFDLHTRNAFCFNG